jgi:hypothetical protein
MFVQGSRVELGEQVNAPQTGVDAVGDRDIDEPILAGQRHRRFRAFFGQREQTRALAAAHDYGENIAGVDGLAAGVCHGKAFSRFLDAKVTYSPLGSKKASSIES